MAAAAAVLFVIGLASYAYFAYSVSRDGGETLVLDRLHPYSGTFGNGVQMRLCMQADLVARILQNSGDHGGGRTFSSRAADVDALKTLLRILYMLQQRAHAVEPSRKARRAGFIG